MVHWNLYPSKKVQEAILKQLRDEDIKKFFYKQVLPWFKDTYYLHQIADENRIETLFFKQAKDGLFKIHMWFAFKAYYDDNEYTTPYDFGLGFSLFNVFRCDGIRGDQVGVIDGDLAKKWMKFLKEKIPEYAPVLEEYRAKLTKLVKKQKERKIKEIEQETEEELEELNDSLPD